MTPPLTPWHRTAGVEMTFQFVCKDKKEFFGCHDSYRIIVRSPEELAYDTSMLHKDLPLPKITCASVRKKMKASRMTCCPYIDPYVIEVPTKILKSWKDAKEAIETILDIAHSNKMCHKMKEYSTGGGGHVHIGVKETKRSLAELILTAQIDIANRPYIPWFFADALTTTEANVWTSNKFWNRSFYRYCLNAEKIAKAVRKSLTPFEEKIMVYPIWDYKQPYLLEDNFAESMAFKGYPLVYRPIFKTFEFRFFDTHNSWKGYEESIAFAQAYMEYLCNLVRDRKEVSLKFTTRKQMLDKFDDFDLCVKEFKGLIKMLNLPWNRYKHYISNLEERFEDIKLLV